jgi:hypothetical protein
MSRNIQFVLIRHRHRLLGLIPMLNIQLATLYVEHLDFTSRWSHLENTKLFYKVVTRTPDVAQAARSEGCRWTDLLVSREKVRYCVVT